MLFNVKEPVFGLYHRLMPRCILFYSLPTLTPLQVFLSGSFKFIFWSPTSPPTTSFHYTPAALHSIDKQPLIRRFISTTSSFNNTLDILIHSRTFLKGCSSSQLHVKSVGHITIAMRLPVFVEDISTVKEPLATWGSSQLCDLSGLRLRSSHQVHLQFPSVKAVAQVKFEL